MQRNPTLTLIGHVESPLTDPKLAPKQGNEGFARCVARFPPFLS